MLRRLALVVLALVTSSNAAASSLAREPILKALRSALDDVRSCAESHYLHSGQYSLWIEVDARGRGKAQVRDAPAPLAPAARRCLARAFERPRYPTVGQALVAWSAASPPGRTYSVAYPFELLAYASDALGPTERMRPAPARTRHIAARRPRVP